MTDPQRSLIAVLLDRSGSMAVSRKNAAPVGAAVAGFSDEDRAAAQGEQ